MRVRAIAKFCKIRTHYVFTVQCVVWYDGIIFTRPLNEIFAPNYSSLEGGNKDVDLVYVSHNTPTRRK